MRPCDSGSPTGCTRHKKTSWCSRSTPTWRCSVYHERGKEKLAALREVLGDLDAVRAFVPDGDSLRAYNVYCETILGEGFRLPHLWSESGRFGDFKTRNPMDGRDWIVDDPTGAAACMRNWGRISSLT